MSIVYPPPLCKMITRFCLTSKAQGHKTNICYIPMSDLSTVQFLLQNDPSLLLKRWYFSVSFPCSCTTELRPQPPTLWTSTLTPEVTLACSRPHRLAWEADAGTVRATCAVTPGSLLPASAGLTSNPAIVCSTQGLTPNLKPPSLKQGG